MTCSTKSPFYFGSQYRRRHQRAWTVQKRYRVRSGKGLAIPVCCLFLAAHVAQWRRMASVSMELVEMMELNIIYDSFFCMMVRMTKMDFDVGICFV
jgi:hypothetical protein